MPPHQLAKNIGDLLSSSLKEDHEYVDRPYLVMTFALVAFAVGQERAAFNEMDDLLGSLECGQLNKKGGRRSLKEDDINSIKRAVNKCWLNARVRITLFYIMEEWVRKNSNIPQIYHTFHFKNIEHVVKVLQGFDAINEASEKFGNLAALISSNGYTHLPNDPTHECQLGGPEVQLVYSLFGFQIAYIDHMLEEPKSKYSEDYLRQAKAFTETFDKISLECIHEQFKFQRSALLRADMLRVTAKYEFAHYQTIVATLKAPKAEAELQNVKSIIELAKGTLDEVQSQDPTCNPDFEPEDWTKVAPTSCRETAEELAALGQEVARVSDAQ